MRQARTVILNGWRRFASAVQSISNADPRTTFLKLIDPIDLDPNFLLKMRNYRGLESSAKINLALSGSAVVQWRRRDRRQGELAGRIHIGPEIDYLERAFDAAKYGDYSPAPYLDITIPSLTDPSLAPAGKHVMSSHVQFAPYKLNDR